MDPTVDEDIIVEILRRARKNQPREPVDGHEYERYRQDSPPRFDESPDVRQELPGMVRISWFSFQLSVIGESQRLNPTEAERGSRSRMKGYGLTGKAENRQAPPELANPQILPHRRR